MFGAGCFYLRVSLEPHICYCTGKSFSKGLFASFHYGTYDCPTVASHCGEPEDIYPYITNSLQRGLILAPGEPFVVPFKYSAKSSS